MEESSVDQPRVLWSCTISTHMRSLAKVLGAFDKIGRDLFIEAAPDRLLLRTLNQAQSAFCLCTLPVSLFDHFEVGDDPPTVKIWLKVGRSPTFARPIVTHLDRPSRPPSGPVLRSALLRAALGSRARPLCAVLFRPCAAALAALPLADRTIDNAPAHAPRAVVLRARRAPHRERCARSRVLARFKRP
jgi:hypothetical protein